MLLVYVGDETFICIINNTVQINVHRSIHFLVKKVYSSLLISMFAIWIFISCPGPQTAAPLDCHPPTHQEPLVTHTTFSGPLKWFCGLQKAYCISLPALVGKPQDTAHSLPDTLEDSGGLAVVGAPPATQAYYPGAYVPPGWMAGTPLVFTYL